MGMGARNATIIVRVGYLSLPAILLAVLSLSASQPLAPPIAPTIAAPLAPALQDLPPPHAPQQPIATASPLHVPIPAPPALESPGPVATAPLAHPLPVCPPLPECPPSAVPEESRPRLPARSFERVRQGPHLWGSAEFLLWNVSEYTTPPLVTTGPAQFPVGFLGNPGTQILFGGSPMNSGVFPGGRFMAGIWIGECVRTGLEADYFFLAEQSNSTTFSSDAYPVLARPFTNANTGTPFSEFGAFSGIATGNMGIDTTAELWGAGVRLRQPLGNRCRGGIDLLAGFQFLSLKESLTVAETPTFLPGGPFPTLSGLSFIAVDRFATSNQFYGGQLGIAARHRRGHWLIDLRALIGLGSTHQEVDIQGGQRVTDAAGNVALYQGGLLALPGVNIGRASRDVFSVVPQVGVNLGYQITNRLAIFAGYSFLYWSDVVRPGDQIDPVLDVTRIPNFITTAAPLNPPRPVNPFKSSDLWVHGVNFGLGLNW